MQTIRRTLLVVIAAWSLAVLAACGGSGDGSSPPAGPATTGGGGLAADYTGRDRMPEAQLADVRSRTTDEAQLAALKDGVVTFAEYEAAALNWAQCLRDGGSTITSGPTLAPGDRIVFTFAGVPGPAGDRTIGQTLVARQNDCHITHLQAVIDVWAWQTRPSEEAFAEARVAVLACLRERGHELPADPAPNDPDFLAASQTRDFDTCAREAAGIHNIDHAAIRGSMLAPPAERQ